MGWKHFLPNYSFTHMLASISILILLGLWMVFIVFTSESVNGLTTAYRMINLADYLILFTWGAFGFYSLFLLFKLVKRWHSPNCCGKQSFRSQFSEYILGLFLVMVAIFSFASLWPAKSLTTIESDAKSLIILGLAILAIGWFIERRKNTEQTPQEKLSMPNGSLIKEGTIKNEDKQTGVMQEAAMPTKKDLLIDTLTKMGCQYKTREEEDGRYLSFQYQGKEFLADLKYGNEKYLLIMDVKWSYVKLYDDGLLSKMKYAINSANSSFPVTTFYTIDEIERKVHVDFKSYFLFISQIPYLDGYLNAQLNDFFAVQKFILNEIAALNEMDCTISPL